MTLTTNNELLPDAHHHLDEVNIACGAHPGEEPATMSHGSRTVAAVIATAAALAVLGMFFL